MIQACTLHRATTSCSRWGRNGLEEVIDNRKRLCLLSHPSAHVGFCDRKCVIRLPSTSDFIKTYRSDNAGNIRCARGRKTFRNTRRAQHTPAEALHAILASASEEDGNLNATLDYQSRRMQLPDWFNVLEEIGNRDRWLVALEVFRWMQQQKWYRPDDGFYAKLIAIMGKKGQLRLAMWLFREMKRSGCRTDTSVYNSLIAALVRGSDKEKALQKAFGYLEKMKQKVRCQPNLVTYNILLRACAKACQFEKVDELFKEMQGVGIHPDSYSFNGILDAYGKAGCFLEMELVLKKMRQEMCKPDIVTFNTLIDAYGKGNIIVKMEQAFKSMLDSKVKPELPTFNSLINNYGKLGLVDKMEWAFQKMIEADICPSLVTYEVLMLGYGNAGSFTKVRECFHMMIQAGIKPEISTLNGLLVIHCSHGLLNEAEALLDNANKMGLRPTALSYSIIFKAYAKDRCFNKLEHLMEKMEATGIKPNKNLFLDALETYGLEAQLKPVNEEVIFPDNTQNELQNLPVHS